MNMKNIKGRRMPFENEIEYTRELIENYPDPSDIGGSSYTAGTGINITNDTISTDPDYLSATVISADEMATGELYSTKGVNNYADLYIKTNGVGLGATYKFDKSKTEGTYTVATTADIPTNCVTYYADSLSNLNFVNTPDLRFYYGVTNTNGIDNANYSELKYDYLTFHKYDPYEGIQSMSITPDFTNGKLDVDTKIQAKDSITIVDSNNSNNTAIYASNGVYLPINNTLVSLQPNSNTYGSESFYLPENGGTLALTSDVITSYNDLTDKPTIPTATSQLSNDSGFITSSSIPTNYVTTDTDQNQIFGEKTFLGKRNSTSITYPVKIQQASNQPQQTIGIQLLNNSGTEVGNVKTIRQDLTTTNTNLFCSVGVENTANSTKDRLLGFKYVSNNNGTTYRCNAIVPPHYTSSSTVADYNAYIPLSVNNVKADDKGNISLPIPTAAPTVAGTYTLQATVDAQGNVTYAWV